jgi:hypothetical protein
MSDNGQTPSVYTHSHPTVSRNASHNALGNTGIAESCAIAPALGHVSDRVKSREAGGASRVTRACDSFALCAYSSAGFLRDFRVSGAVSV